MVFYSVEIQYRTQHSRKTEKIYFENGSQPVGSVESAIKNLEAIIEPGLLFPEVQQRVKQGLSTYGLVPSSKARGKVRHLRPFSYAFEKE